MVTLARKAGINIEQLEETHKELREFPFDSARKRMTSVRLWEGELTAFAKGAPEQIVKVCSHIWDGTRADTALLLEEVKLGCTLGMLQCLDRPHRLAYVLGSPRDSSGRPPAYASLSS